MRSLDMRRESVFGDVELTVYWCGRLPQMELSARVPRRTKGQQTPVRLVHIKQRLMKQPCLLFRTRRTRTHSTLLSGRSPQPPRLHLPPRPTD